MRIAFVNTLYPPHGSSGAEVTLQFLAARLAARGHACTVMTLTPNGQPESRIVDGIPVHYLPLANVYWPHGGRRPKPLRPLFQAIDAFNPIMQRRLATMLRAVGPEVVNCHNMQGFSCSAWRAASDLGIPVVQTLHDYYTACSRSAMWRPSSGNCATLCPECRGFAAPRRRLSRLPTIVTCVSHRVFDRLYAAGAYPEAAGRGQSIRIIRGNNPLAAVPPLPDRPTDGLLRLGFIGRLEPSKGLTNLLDAFAKLPARTARLSIAGRGEPKFVAGLQARATLDVEFLGQVDPAAFFPLLDLLVIPSVWEDPFPRVFHEALAYGVPSLVTPLGGLPEAIAPGRTGFVAGAADASSLHECLLGLLQRGWDREAMRSACREAAADYAPERIVGEYEEVMLAAAERRAPGKHAGEPWLRQRTPALAASERR